MAGHGEFSPNQVAQLSSLVATAVSQAFAPSGIQSSGQPECSSSRGGLAINRTSISTSTTTNEKH